MTGSEMVEARAVSARSAAFVRLADEHLDDSYRLAHAILGTRSDAEDATHDALGRAWRRWPQLRDHALFEPWFHRILVNTCRDRLRRASKWHIQDLSTEIVSVAATSAVDAVHDREQMRSAMSRLSPDHRIAVTLRYYLDLPIEEIAVRVGVPAGTVKSRLHEALRQMRKGMDP